MARVNVPAVNTRKTHEGITAHPINLEQELRRSVMANMLWESEFYENGEDNTKRIAELVPKVKAERVANIAIDARSKMKLRHVPLLIVREMARSSIQHRLLVADTLEEIIQRPDELTEFLAIYWKDDKDQPLSAQVKKGLARAFSKFSEYSLAKYDRNGAVKLRDVLFLSHAKPKDTAQVDLFRRLVNKQLETPDTWEVELSAGKGEDKKASWTRLLREDRLGSLALLRNLRNMTEAGVDRDLLFSAVQNMKTDRVLPFRFIAAARYASWLEPQLETAMFSCLKDAEKLSGHTVLLVDCSPSMDSALSDKSQMTREDAANGLAILLREICEDVSVFAFSSECKLVAPRRGFALRDAIHQAVPSNGTLLKHAMDRVHIETSNHGYDRLIVITDEESQDGIGKPLHNGVLINVASYKNGIGYGEWLHVDGFSEAVIDYIRMVETVKP